MSFARLSSFQSSSARRPNHAWLACGLLLMMAGACHAQAPAPKAAASTAAPAKRVVISPGPAWGDLTPAQRDALAPLASIWGSISEIQKRKWISLAKGFADMPAADQARIRERMTEWASLSPAQRMQARLNFKETRDLSSQEKQQRWDAYQKLSPAEKARLADDAKAAKDAKARATAPSTALAPRSKLAEVPPTRTPRASAAPASAAASEPHESSP